MTAPTITALRLSKSRIASLAATSLYILHHDYNKTTNIKKSPPLTSSSNHDNNINNNNHHHDTNQRCPPLIPPLVILPRLPPLSSPTTTLCSTSSSPPLRNTPSTNTNNNMIIKRHRTLIRMKDTATTSPLLQKYSINFLRPLGVGAFGTVYLAREKSSSTSSSSSRHRSSQTTTYYACKKISQKQTNAPTFQREMDALLHIRDHGGHPHICSLRENFQEAGFYYLILDFVGGGEMFDHLVTNGAYSEADAARLVREVTSALAFLHGVGMVHRDLKPENLMLSSKKGSEAVIKLVDFGAAEINEGGKEWSWEGGGGGGAAVRPATPAYSPPEVLGGDPTVVIHPSFDMWSLGVIVYIMLTGFHPFDLSGESTDEEIVRRVRRREAPPLHDHPLTNHLSPAAKTLISRLLSWEARDRPTALELLEDPWVRGETASRRKVKGLDEKLGRFRVFKSRLQAQVFGKIVNWSDDYTEREGGVDGDGGGRESVGKKTSLVERAFKSYDTQQRGFLTTNDLLTSDDNKSNNNNNNNNTPVSSGDENENLAHNLNLSEFSDLLSENMKNHYYPTNHIIYNENDIGHHMYFINSGTIQISTSDGTLATRTQGDFFGEGALLHPQSLRSATVRCLTPVHALAINREYFEKYLRSEGMGLTMAVKEKDRIRKRNRAKSLLRCQKNLIPRTFRKGEYLFKEGENCGMNDGLYILESGRIDLNKGDDNVFNIHVPGDLCGEHSLIMNRPRNVSAVCRGGGEGDDACHVYQMKPIDFYKLLDESPNLKRSMKEICYRREFQKALVKKTGKPFPNVNDLREAFDAADVDGGGTITVEEFKSVLRGLDETLSEGEMEEVIESLCLIKRGEVTFEEFKHIFGMSDNKSKSL